MSDPADGGEPPDVPEEGRTGADDTPIVHATRSRTNNARRGVVAKDENVIITRRALRTHI